MNVRKRTWKTPDGKKRTSYFVDYVDPVTGERQRHTLKGIKDKPLADKAAAKFYSELVERAHLGESAGPTDIQKLLTLGQFLDDDLQRVIQPSTRATESHQHKPLKRILGKDLPLQSLTLAMLERYQVKRSGENVANSTINDELAVLRAALNRGVRAKRLWKMPCHMPERLPEEKPKIRFLKADQVERLFAAMRELYPETADNAEMMYRLGGLRPIELWSIQWKHVDFELNILSVLSRKHGRSKEMEWRHLPMTSRVLDILQRKRAEHGDASRGDKYVFGKLPADRTRRYSTSAKKLGHKDGVVFLGDYRLGYKFKAAAAKAKLPDPDSVTPYVLRHSAATNAEGGTAKEISKMLGHRDVRTTMEIYQHLRDDRFESAINSLSGHKIGTKKKGRPKSAQ